MADFEKLSSFQPQLKPFDILPWYRHSIIRAHGRIQFINDDERKIIEHIRNENPTIGQLNEELYRQTNRVSPLNVIRLLIELNKRDLLINGQDFQELLPPVSNAAQPRTWWLKLGSIPGLKSRLGLVFPIILALYCIALPFKAKLNWALPNLLPFDNVIASIAAYPLAMLALINIRGILGILAFLFAGGSAAVGIDFRWGFPALQVHRRGILSGLAPDRIGFHIFHLLVYPAIALTAAAMTAQASGILLAGTGIILWSAVTLAFMDFFLLGETRACLLLEELSREPELPARFRQFWNRAFATLGSFFKARFTKEELYYSMGIWQLIWFAAYAVGIVQVLSTGIPPLIGPAMNHGLHLLLPAVLIGSTAALFFILTFIVFILRKTVGLTASMFELGSGLIQTHDKTQRLAGDQRVDLHDIHIFSNLPEKELEQINDHVAVSERNPDKLLIKEGELGSTLLAIRKGQALVYRTLPEGGIVELAYLKEGDVFGERALLGDGKRTANVKSLTPMELYVVPRSVFDDIQKTIGKSSRISQIIMAANAVQRSHIFTDLPPQMVIRFAANVEPVHYNDGDTILAKGSPSNDTFYIVHRGSVTVKEAGPEGEDVQLGVNSHFGEIALLNDAPRSADVIADGPVTVFAFQKKDFLNVLFADFEALLKLETEGQRRLAELEGTA